MEKILEGKSILLIAPTGLGKTFAVTGDITKKNKKIVYAVPLRALGFSIKDSIASFSCENQKIDPVIHYGNIKESTLFSEEVIITTYDQVVCGIPGLPLSLPLKSGHAVAGAILMSRLIFDEVHLAWSISDQALAILFAIIEFRTKKLGLPTVILTATLPDDVAKQISEQYELDLLIVGEGELANDEGLKQRDINRHVILSQIVLKNKRGQDNKQLDYESLDDLLKNYQHKRIYFSNTVDRIQQTYDRLIHAGMNPAKILILHNRMPGEWRASVEKKVREYFGSENSSENDLLLLTNQVAEAGLDISAPLVISDPAPVDTLLQRAGRCARWFRNGPTQGKFYIIKTPSNALSDWARPYRDRCVSATLKVLPENKDLSWKIERQWINDAWGLQLDGQGKMPKNPKERRFESIDNIFNQTAFALNLFDRAVQERKPGQIARVFRDILSIEIAIENTNFNNDYKAFLEQKKWPETSIVSLGRAWSLLREANGTAKAIRNEDGELRIVQALDVQLGDIIIVPSTIAYLHKVKGLCFGDVTKEEQSELVLLNSDWRAVPCSDHLIYSNNGRRQTLLDHTQNVMRKTYEKLSSDGSYYNTLVKILEKLEPEKNPNQLAIIIAQIAQLAAGFHDLGKADLRWQTKARLIDSERPTELIGRTIKTASSMGIPHTPPGFNAIVKACDLLIGLNDSTTYLIHAIALAAVRHHSSLFNPASIDDYIFYPHDKTVTFIKEVLKQLDAPDEVIEQADKVILAAKTKPLKEQVPLMLPNDDLFPIYALVGRAILMADREDASNQDLEHWRD